jgi:hypothetical protein
MITATGGDLNGVQFVSRDVAWLRKNEVRSGAWIQGASGWLRSPGSGQKYRKQPHVQ